VQIAGSVDAEAVSEALTANRFDTVPGELSSDAKGDITEPAFVLYRWSEGQYDYF
jgi:branched-chain amino acid transport system substrate-binding protein